MILRLSDNFIRVLSVQLLWDVQNCPMNGEGKYTRKILHKIRIMSSYVAFVKWFPGVMGTGATTRIGNDPVIITDSMGQKHGNVWIEVHGKLFMENTVRPKNYGCGLCLLCLLWLLHMRTSSMETFSSLLALYVGNSPVTGEFPSQRPVTWKCDVFVDLCMNKWLSKQSWGWWFDAIMLIMMLL